MSQQNKADLQITKVKITDIEPNQYNPNEMDASKFALLVKEITNQGFLVPIVLRKDKGKYIIIDGEHRFRAAKVAGYKEVPAIVADKDLPESMISTINLNRIKGDFDSIKLARVISDLNKTYSMEELESKLGIPSDDLTGMTELLELDLTDLEPDLPEPENEPELQSMQFSVRLSPTNYNLVMKAIELSEEDDLPEALVAICTEFMKNNLPKNRKNNG